MVTLSKVCSEYWISRLVKYSLEENCVLKTSPHPGNRLSNPNIVLDPIWRADLTLSQPEFFHWEGLHSQRDLLFLDKSFQGPVWHAECTLSLRYVGVLPSTPTPMIAPTFAVGQLWPVRYPNWVSIISVSPSNSFDCDVAVDVDI